MNRCLRLYIEAVRPQPQQGIKRSRSKIMSSKTKRPVAEIAESHPMLAFLRAVSRVGAKVVNQKDLYMGTLGSSAFACAFEPDGSLALGVPVSDLDAFTSVEWNSAALLRGLKGQDFLALNCRDVGAKAPIGWRLFLHVTADVADAIEKGAPKRLRLRPMKVVRGQPLAAKGAPKADLPFAALQSEQLRPSAA